MLKKFLKRWFRNFLCLLGLSYFYPGFSISGGITMVIIAALLLYLIQVFLHPLIKVLFLPVNIITLGMFRWLIVSIHLLIIAFLLNPVTFTPFFYKTFNIYGIIIPAGEINLIFSIIIGTIVYRYLRKIILFIT